MHGTKAAISFPGRFYVEVGARNVEIKPSWENDRLIWSLVDAAGWLTDVKESEIRWTSGEISTECAP